MLLPTLYSQHFACYDGQQPTAHDQDSIKGERTLEARMLKDPDWGKKYRCDALQNLILFHLTLLQLFAYEFFNVMNEIHIILQQGNHQWLI
jgi:hypothetical protein